MLRSEPPLRSLASKGSSECTDSHLGSKTALCHATRLTSSADLRFTSGGTHSPEEISGRGE